MRSYYVSHTRKVFVYSFIFQELTYLLCVICSINQYLLSVCYFQEKSIPFKRFKVIPKNPMIYCDPRTWATYPAGSVSSSLKRRYYLTCRIVEMISVIRYGNHDAFDLEKNKHLIKKYLSPHVESFREKRQQKFWPRVEFLQYPVTHCPQGISGHVFLFRSFS